MAALADQTSQRRSFTNIVQNVATLDDYAVWFEEIALESRDAWAATVRVARARRELGLTLGEDFDCLHGATRGRHVPTNFRTVSWSRVPGHVLSYPPGEPLPDDLVAKLDELDSLIATPADELDDLLLDFGLDPTEMAHNRSRVSPRGGSPLPPSRISLCAPHILKARAALARLVIGPGKGEAARGEVWERVDHLVGRDCDPEVWFNQGLVCHLAFHSLLTDQHGNPFPANEYKVVVTYEELEDVMRNDTDRWRAAEADISGHELLPDP